MWNHAAPVDVESPPLTPPARDEAQPPFYEVLGIGAPVTVVVLPNQVQPPIQPPQVQRSHSADDNPAPAAVENPTCPICLTPVEPARTFTVPGCGHKFCCPCLASYLTTQVNDGRIELRCPFLGENNQRCSTTLNDDAVSQVVADHAVLAKHQRFRATRLNPNMRVCPNCNALQEGAPERPAMTCGACGASFCFTHSTAHSPAEPCGAYDERVRTQDPDSITLVSRTSKACPRCRVPTYKYEGCSHMTCSRCDQHWCWICGESFAVSGMYINHYSPLNLTSGCAGRLLIQGEGCCSSLLRMLLYYSPLAIPIYIVALLLFFTISLFILPCLLTRSQYSKYWLRRRALLFLVNLCWTTLYFAFFFSLLFALVLVAWIIGLLVGLVSLPILAAIDCAEFPRRLSWCVGWPVLLVVGVLDELNEGPA